MGLTETPKISHCSKKEYVTRGNDTLMTLKMNLIQ